MNQKEQNKYWIEINKQINHNTEKNKLQFFCKSNKDRF